MSDEEKFYSKELRNKISATTSQSDNLHSISVFRTHTISYCVNEAKRIFTSLFASHLRYNDGSSFERPKMENFLSQ